MRTTRSGSRQPEQNVRNGAADDLGEEPALRVPDMRAVSANCREERAQFGLTSRFDDDEGRIEAVRNDPDMPGARDAERDAVRVHDQD